MRDFILMVDTGTDDDAVFLLIPRPQPAGTILFTLFCPVPDQPSQYGIQLLFIGIKGKSMFPGVFFCPASECLNFFFIHAPHSRRHPDVRMHLPMICVEVLKLVAWGIPPLLHLEQGNGLPAFQVLLSTLPMDTVNWRLELLSRSSPFIATLEEVRSFQIPHGE